MKKELKSLLLYFYKRFLRKKTVPAEYNESRSHKGLIDYLMQYEKITKDNNVIDSDYSFESFNSVGIVMKREESINGGFSFETIFPNAKVYYCDDDDWLSCQIFFVIGLGYSYRTFLHQLILSKSRCYILEENYLRSIAPVSMKRNSEIPRKFFRPVSYFIESKAPHFCSSFSSSIEFGLNSEEKVTPEMSKKVNDCIDKIVKNNVSKYNCQKEMKINLPNNGKKNILIIDQAFNDYSVVASGGTQKSFENMLNKAMSDNPGCNYIIKTHVDKYSRETYFSRIFIPDNVFIYSESSNPINFIKNIDYVYTYSSTMGFEALMCNKKVFTFGSPIYAGWGLTEDYRDFSHKRLKNRTLVEVFFYIYIKYSIYIDTRTNRRCDLLQAIDCLIELRKEFLDADGNFNI